MSSNHTHRPPSKARDRVRKRHARSSKSGSEWAWLVVVGAVLGGLIVGGLVLGLLAAGGQSEVLPTAAVDFGALPTFDAASAVNFKTGQNVVLENGYSFILEPWDGESRFTVLLMGLDRRPDEIGLAYRTDTIILVSLNPTTDQIGILNIPRDLHVAMPGFDNRQQVNIVLALGEGSQPGSGPEVAMSTIQYNFGIHVHDYIIADFDAVIGLIDAIGGIEVTTDYTIDDPFYPDMNYGYDPFYLPAGTHQLSGRDALKFARTRHGDNDFERAARQQQVLFAIRDRILNFDMIPQLILQAPGLLKTFEDNVYTSLDLDEMIELAWYLKDQPLDNLQTGVVNFDYISTLQTDVGSSILALNHATLGELMVDVFGANYSE